MLENADRKGMKRMNATGCETISWTEKRQNIYLFQSRCLYHCIQCSLGEEAV